MKTNKILILSILMSITIGCKNSVQKQNVFTASDTSKVENTKKLSEETIDLKKISDKSFVISCGSGCAMTYTVEQIKNNGSFIKVKFKVEMYVDEALSDTYNEVYIFIYDKSKKINKIELEGKKQNVLETLMPDVQESFRKFGEDLMKYITSQNPIKEQDFSQFYSSLNSITLPFEYSFEFIVDKTNFESIPKNMQIFSEKGSDNYFAIKMPKINDNVNVILVSSDNEAGQTVLDLYTLSNKYLVIDKLNLYFSEETDNGGSILTTYYIDKDYKINIQTEIIKNKEKKNVEKKYYIINETGRFIEIKSL